MSKHVNTSVKTGEQDPNDPDSRGPTRQLSLAKGKKGKGLRAQLPERVVKHLGVAVGDKLEWQMLQVHGKNVVMVQKIEAKSEWLENHPKPKEE